MELSFKYYLTRELFKCLILPDKTLEDEGNLVSHTSLGESRRQLTILYPKRFHGHTRGACHIQQWVLNDIGKIGFTIQSKEAAQSPLVSPGHSVIMVYNLFFFFFLSLFPQYQTRTRTLFKDTYNFYWALHISLHYRFTSRLGSIKASGFIIFGLRKFLKCVFWCYDPYSHTRQVCHQDTTSHCLYFYFKGKIFLPQLPE